MWSMVGGHGGGPAGEILDMDRDLDPGPGPGPWFLIPGGDALCLAEEMLTGTVVMCRCWQ